MFFNGFLVNIVLFNSALENLYINLSSIIHKKLVTHCSFGTDFVSSTKCY